MMVLSHSLIRHNTDHISPAHTCASVVKNQRLTINFDFTHTSAFININSTNKLKRRYRSLLSKLNDRQNRKKEKISQIRPDRSSIA